MRCFYCNKHEAVKSYERVEKGEVKREYYCLSCYEKLFLCVKDAESDQSLSVCPYCERTVAEFEGSKLVGCSYCYKTMQRDILPVVVKMQGSDSGHRGKKPLLSEGSEARLKAESFATNEERDEYRNVFVKKERFERQKKELEMLVAYLERRNPERAQEYREKLERMLKAGEVEEELVW